MDKDFNLLDEKWIPIRMVNGESRDFGLLELFRQAGNICELAEPSPASLIALYRVLLVITHCALTRAMGLWGDNDRELWYREGLPQEALQDYLENFRDRFWLFHAEQPFMQVASLTNAIAPKDRKPWTQISLANACGNAPVIFDHSIDRAPSAITRSEAIRTLLGFLQFTPGGLVRVIRKSDKAGPLANTAATLVLGRSLNETLCLALHPANSSAMDDFPSWERPPILWDNLHAAPSLSTGINDHYTHLSRAVLLDQEYDGKVRWVYFAAGIALQDDASIPDPMASYRSGRKGPIRLSFREGRALWRDLPTLIPNAQDHGLRPAAVLEWASTLRKKLGDWPSAERLLVAGVTSDQAKLLRWQVEQITFPSAFWSNRDLADYLICELQRAENVHGRLSNIAVSMIAASVPSTSMKNTREAAHRAFIASCASPTFFVLVECALPRLFQEIAEGALERAHLHWSEALRLATRNTWNLLRQLVGQTPRALRAEARALMDVSVLLRTLEADLSIFSPEILP